MEHFACFWIEDLVVEIHLGKCSCKYKEVVRLGTVNSSKLFENKIKVTKFYV